MTEGEKQSGAVRSEAMEELWTWLPDLPRNASDTDIAKAAIARILELRQHAKVAGEFMVEMGMWDDYLKWQHAREERHGHTLDWAAGLRSSPALRP